MNSLVEKTNFKSFKRGKNKCQNLNQGINFEGNVSQVVFAKDGSVLAGELVLGSAELSTTDNS